MFTLFWCNWSQPLYVSCVTVQDGEEGAAGGVPGYVWGEGWVGVGAGLERSEPHVTPHSSTDVHDSSFRIQQHTFSSVICRSSLQTVPGNRLPVMYDILYFSSWQCGGINLISLLSMRTCCPKLEKHHPKIISKHPKGSVPPIWEPVFLFLTILHRILFTVLQLLTFLDTSHT